MKIQSINVQNFLGARAVDVKLDMPIALFAGANYQGKSSIQEAVRMALTGEGVRVGLKKDYSQIVSEGQEAGFAEVLGIDEGQDFTASIVLPSGKGQHSTDTALPFVLDSQRFAKLPENERRSFLFGLMGVKLGGKDVEERMKARGCDDAKASSIAPFLRAGFDAAHKEAQGKGRECKAQWKTVTGGETYGSQKAASFKVAKQEVDTSDLEGARNNLVIMDSHLEKLNQQLGELQGAARQLQEHNSKLEGLRQKAAMFARIQEKLNRDQASLEEWNTKVMETREKAGATPKQTTAPAECPHCGGNILIVNGTLEAWHEETLPHYDVNAAAKLPEYEKALALLQSTVSNDTRDLAAADLAAKTLKELEEGAQEVPSAEAIAKLKAEIDTLKHDRANQAAGIRMIEDAARQANEADDKTAKAMALHHDVQAWEKIADALAPDGIPGEMLSEALAPINERLSISSDTSEWPQVFIGSDMSIGIDSKRDYSLLSESEKWRVDAMIAEAVSFISGTRLLVLDRFDVLDLKGREDLLYWLDTLAADGEIDTALIFGTLKALPGNLPDTMSGHWIEHGVCGQLKEAA